MSQRIVMIDTVALTGIYGNGPPNDDVGNPPDPEYAKLMWKWIEKTLSEVILPISYVSSFLENFPNGSPNGSRLNYLSMQHSLWTIDSGS